MYEADDGLFFQPGNTVTSLIRDRIGCGLVMLSWVMKMIWYHGEKKASSYFEGWYLKCQTSDGRCFALIPAIHIDDDGCKTASIQVLTENQSWWLSFPGDAFHAQKDVFYVQIGSNIFSKHGMELAIHEDGIDLEGKIRFGSLEPLRYSIMGPFEMIPNMECAHGIISMKHRLKGKVSINGETLHFDEGIGYIESDRGCSFPSSYLWAQDIWTDSSFMLSIAKIPLGKLTFTGCISAIHLNGKEYRIATYLGARVKQWNAQYASVQQGRYLLEVEVLRKQEHPLKAPCTGSMLRTVHESLCAVIRIRFMRGDKVLLDRTTDRAGFEFSNDP